jgi:protein TonB
MRRRNLTFAALFSVALIAGLAWWGEQTHFRAIHRPPSERPPTPTPFVLEPDPPTPVDATSTAPRPKDEAVARPELQDAPAKPAPDQFVVPVEPPHPLVEVKMTKIPPGGDRNGPAFRPFDPSQLDVVPAPKFQARPVYPDSMKKQGISGEVLVDFIVDPEGNVRYAVSARSSMREFEEAACNAVSRWKFRPGRKDGHAVYVHMQVPIVFTLTDQGGS